MNILLEDKVSVLVGKRVMLGKKSHRFKKVEVKHLCVQNLKSMELIFLNKQKVYLCIHL